MATSPVANVSGPLGISVKINGSAIAEDIAVNGITVTLDINRVPQATVRLADGSVATNEFPLIDGTDFEVSTPIEIAAFFGAGAAQILFKGIITATRLRISGGGAGELELTCRDKAIALMDIRKTSSFAQMKDSDAMAAIIGDAGLSAAVKATTADPSDLVQYDCSDWDFLRLLADRNGQIIIVDDGKVTTDAPDPAGAATMGLTLGIDILDFDCKIDTASLIKDSTVSGWDPASQAVTTETSDSADTGSWGNAAYADLSKVTGDRTHTATTPYAIGQVALADVAKARAMRAPMGAISGRCKYPGSALAEIGKTIEITGVGDHLGGTAYVCGITHEISAGTWETTARLGLPAGWRSDSIGLSTPGAGGLNAPVQGLHVGTVLAIVDSGGSNPMGDDTMIQVSVPLMGETPAELWARYAQPYATGGAGIQFLPEVGDEVILGFLSADPGAPVILGSMHSGSLARTNEATEENELKTITSKSGIHITFDDDKEILTAETPAGQSIVIDDDASTITLTDVTGNTITMSDSGMEMAAQGTFDLTATDTITIASDMDVEITGMNISATADAEMTAEGSASASFSSSGQCTIEGSIVMIN
ncbi:phage baseplate assembly protein V [Yoonia sp. I 8.24]|uniref:phage baseplate assembly protein V n=1 Tax=Yoonia sp. I 8.24 TaxID=1537229 RepID=UPI001EDFF4EB|nr:phage baseplate assembly protein V [Yoonia sp. I 8.24]MCG3266172.1 Rhs element Vgr protein [Yoonia sp. I 8.24]